MKLKPWSLILLLPFALALTAPSAKGQDRMKASGSLSATQAAPGSTITFKLKLEVEAGYHTYPTTQKDPAAAGFVTSVRVKNAKDAPVEPDSKIKEPTPKEKFDDKLSASIAYHEGVVELEMPLKVKAGTPPGIAKFSIVMVTQVCDEMGCVPYNQSFDYEIKIADGKQPKTEPTKEDPPQDTPVGPTKAGAPPAAPAANVAKDSKSSASEETIWSFTAMGIGWGLVTLLTPCVFPMIPITVSFFLKQQATGNKAIVNAGVYTITIIISLTIIAYFFVQSFQKLTQMGSTNFILGALFIYFALSLFGMYEITLPGFLTRWTSAGEAKGGYIGTIFMALTFTIISFSCVAPFLGGFAGATAKERPVSWNIAGALGFAVAFASPFFFLALFPSALKRLPKSGSWLNTMKVVMGFLEVAAALKFFRAAELLWTADSPKYLTYDMVLGMYVTICLLSGLYLIGVFRLPHDDHGDEKKPIGVGRLIWSFVFLGLGFYLLPGMFRSPDGQKLRPAGTVFNWVDAFLLPGSDTKPLKLSFSGNGGLSQEKWYGFMSEALVDAKTKKQRIFIDFTGVS